jgi:hypothetical protein
LNWIVFSIRIIIISRYNSFDSVSYVERWPGLPQIQGSRRGAAVNQSPRQLTLKGFVFLG